MNLNDIVANIPDAQRTIAASTLISDYQALGYSLDLPLEEFITNPEHLFLFTSFVSAQKKSKTIENFVAKKIGGRTIPASQEQGDVEIICPNVVASGLFLPNEHIELKVSTNNDGDNINARQIRLWQELEYYILGYVNEYDLSASAFYLLTHEEMCDICADFAGYSHGTGSVATQNIYAEMSLTIPMYRQTDIGDATAPYYSPELTALICS